MDLSVIIVSYNAREYLRICLHSVRKASENIDCEVFVVDNNSTDGYTEMLKKDFPDFKCIFNTQNVGFAAANNQAIRISKGNYILLLNPDTVVEPCTFTSCLKFMREHPEAGAIGVRMVNGDGSFLPESKRSIPSPLTSFFKITGAGHVFPKSSFFNRYYLPHINKNETAPAEIISGAFMFLNREALVKAGLPDEDFFMYGEDIDLSYRILQAGFKNYYFADTQIIHFKGKSTPRNGYSDLHNFYKAMRVYAKKRNSEKFSLLYLIIIPAIRLTEYISVIFRFFRIRYPAKSSANI
jgi:O-antigen biosynthesis protein